ncbi:DegT/DnrJ/EryC1/StrS family aminotransferase [Halosquirtibacter laminarini]|uniref:DegT/DnrJ/EryC1/StrS family aminotransferase n=1 Tax=Halosquirtibacter laminarini TaxID=3374600 RepID=A0AC61NQZ7_9BACT|nr:DegT/DnrJ/EryC1/StrS family aminotransferase [Prolixibacteraceae bacterium]
MIKKVPFCKVVCDGNELKYITEVIESGWLTTASKTTEFEKLFSKYVESKYACAVNSCTAALHLGLEALGVQRGDKVFVPSLTFTASAEVIRYLGADPVFLDVDYDTKLITPEILKQAVEENPDIKHLILVHYGGHPADLIREKGDGILDICRANNIKIIEDAAHAFPAKIGDKFVGNIGDVTCFSFYANKTITSGEGGMLTTNNEDIYKRVKTMRLHGINRDVWDRFTSDKPSWEYDVVAPGFKYNMPDVTAAIGLAQLERAEDLRLGRQKAVELYYKHLSGLDMVDLSKNTVPFEDHAWHLFTIVLNEKSKIGRNKFIEKLSEKGIGTSVHYKPVHLMTYYKEKYGVQSALSNTEKIWNGTVTLPLFPSMTEEEVIYVCDTIKEILK